MTVDFDMYAGDSKILRIICVDEDDNNSPIDLLNAQDMNFSITNFNGGSDSKLVTKTISDIGIEGLDDNIAVITLMETDTEDLYGKYQYYFQVQDFGGKKFTKSGLCIININGI